MRDPDYDAWKATVWHRPLRSGFAGCVLVLFSIASSLGGVMIAIILLTNLAGGQTHGWTNIVAYAAAGVGVIAYFVVRPVFWRLTHTSRRR